MLVSPCVYQCISPCSPPLGAPLDEGFKKNPTFVAVPGKCGIISIDKVHSVWEPRVRVAPASNLTLERVSGKNSLKAVKEGNKVLVGSCKKHTFGSLFFAVFYQIPQLRGPGRV
jgi:hypothetical protein